MVLAKVDKLIRDQHALLNEADQCYYFGEYTARAGCTYSETNQLVFNFKKEVDRRGRSEYRYKEQAIRKVASWFRQALAPTDIQVAALRQYTLVPTPPSKSKTDALYDDRLIQMLIQMGLGLSLDIRELLVHRSTSRASHGATNRLSVQEIYENLTINEDIAVPPPTGVVLFDDTLVSGAHFVAAKRLLRDRFGEIEVFGMFIARRAIDTNDV